MDSNENTIIMNIYWITTTVLTVGFGEVMAGDPTYDTGPGLFLMYLVLGFFALITAYFSVVEQKRIAHRDNRRAAQRRKHIPHLDEICFTFEEITREQALFRILAINYKLLVEEDIEPWWEAVCAQKCSRGDGKLLSSNDVQQILENKHHTLEDKGETE